MMKLKLGQSRAAFGRSSGFPFCGESSSVGAKPLCTQMLPNAGRSFRRMVWYFRMRSNVG